MLSLSKKKTIKEYIYVRKHTVNAYSLEELISRLKKSKDMESNIVDFYISQINFEKLTFIIKLSAHSDGKVVMAINDIKNNVRQMISEAVSNYIMNPMDSVYISENIIVNLYSYSGKHYLSISPKIDFTK